MGTLKQTQTATGQNSTFKTTVVKNFVLCNSIL